MDPSSEDDANFFNRTLPYYHLIGAVATYWSMLEQGLDETLWQLASTSPDAGACLTAQFLSLSNRFDALLALLKLRNVIAEPLNERIDSFSRKCGSLREKRNRVVHDPVTLDGRDLTKVIRYKIIAKRTLHRRAEDAQLEWYQKVSFEILEALHEWNSIENGIFDRLPEYRQKPRK